jgi:uncharacterized membrane protein
MNQRLIVSSALASALALGLIGQAAAQDKDKDKAKEKEKCYGIAKAGQNDCGNLSGSHSCEWPRPITRRTNGSTWPRAPART